LMTGTSGRILIKIWTISLNKGWLILKTK
jgi:hypothetical protein